MPIESPSSASHLLSQRWRQLSELVAKAQWDVEDLHQFRITLRTLLAWSPLWTICSLPGVENGVTRLQKKLLKQCNDWRERDVFLTYLAYLPHSKRARRTLQRRDPGCRKPAVALLSPLVRESGQRLMVWQQRMTPTLLQELLALQLSLYLQRSRDRLLCCQQGSLRTLHQLRLALKALRYLLEILVAVAPQWRPLWGECRRWQERLGQFADLDSLLRWLRQQQERELADLVQHRRKQLGRLLRSELDELAQLLATVGGQELPTRSQLADYFSLQELDYERAGRDLVSSRGHGGAE